MLDCLAKHCTEADLVFAMKSSFCSTVNTSKTLNRLMLSKLSKLVQQKMFYPTAYNGVISCTKSLCPIYYFEKYEPYSFVHLLSKHKRQIIVGQNHYIPVADRIYSLHGQRCLVEVLLAPWWLFFSDIFQLLPYT